MYKDRKWGNLQSILFYLIHRVLNNLWSIFTHKYFGIRKSNYKIYICFIFKIQTFLFLI